MRKWGDIFTFCVKNKVFINHIAQQIATRALPSNLIQHQSISATRQSSLVTTWPEQLPILGTIRPLLDSISSQLRTSSLQFLLHARRLNSCIISAAAPPASQLAKVTTAPLAHCILGTDLRLCPHMELPRTQPPSVLPHMALCYPELNPLCAPSHGPVLHIIVCISCFGIHSTHTSVCYTNA